MGFTFSHPVLILPFRYLPKKYYSLSGLVIGSIIPDFEYFIRLDSDSSFSHTIPGLFWFDLPLTLIILFFFHQVIRDLMIENLPRFLKTRLLNINRVDWPNYFYQNWMVVIFSVLMGSATHLFWDSFTSFDGYFVVNNPVLLMKTDVFGLQLFNYKILKHISSLLGGLFLFYLIFKLPKTEFKSTKKNKYYWIILILLFCCITSLQLIQTKHAVSYNNMIKKIISCALLALALTSLYYKTKMYLYHTRKD